MTGGAGEVWRKVRRRPRMMSISWQARLFAAHLTAAEYDLYLRLYWHADDTGRLPIEPLSRLRAAIGWTRRKNRSGRDGALARALCGLEVGGFVEIETTPAGAATVQLSGWDDDQALRRRDARYFADGCAGPTAAALRRWPELAEPTRRCRPTYTKVPPYLHEGAGRPTQRCRGGPGNAALRTPRSNRRRESEVCVKGASHTHIYGEREFLSDAERHEMPIYRPNAKQPAARDAASAEGDQ